MASNKSSAPAPANVRVPLGKSGHVFDVQVARFSPEVFDFVFNYGLRQIINDAAASGKTPDEKLGLANKRLESLYEGALRQQRESDPLARHAKAIAEDLGRRKGHKDEALKAFVAKAKSDPAVLHLAQKRLDEEAALNIDISLD